VQLPPGAKLQGAPRVDWKKLTEVNKEQNEKHLYFLEKRAAT